MVGEKEVKSSNEFLTPWERAGFESTTCYYKQLPDQLFVVLINFGIFIIGFLLFPINPILTFVFSVLLTIGFYLELNGVLLLSYFLPLGNKENLVLKLPGSKARGKVVFIIPRYYVPLTKSYIKGKFYRYIFIYFVFLILACLILLPSLLHSFRYSTPVMLYWYGLLALVIPMLVYTSIIFWKSYNLPRSVGTRNTYAEELFLDLFNNIEVQGGLENLDVYLLLTSDRSGDYSGVMNFLETHGHELKDAYFINLEFFSGGKISLTSEEGLIKRYKVSRKLSLGISGIGSQTHFPKISIMRSAKIITSLTFLLAKSYEGISVVSQGKLLGEEYDYKKYFQELLKGLNTYL